MCEQQRPRLDCAYAQSDLGIWAVLSGPSLFAKNILRYYMIP